ncbi:MAG: LapA family protein [Piscinibacter sp.]|uniref:lipopolysaccharide assembly protein LapA domain-containing protein n=1 Tax=Piscinibacter sp. TaxID=1903157 RepID=UPI001B604E3E|nr:lipopolysaccharide assembly protein LapA domain-containing protein [Piscinibacter sp.]MBP5989074.1 LapA family protein [Piscinibacter sp.]MBP6026206.1 LapA family protein [Piscinibacter sp.]
MRLLVWLVRAALFFLLFAFALNNQHEASIRWFFGHEWRTNMVFVVLAAFALGCVFGIMAMLPSWWRQRSVARRRRSSDDGDDSSQLALPTLTPEHPPRDGI